jgi:hypothetical protein
MLLHGRNPDCCPHPQEAAAAKARAEERAALQFAKKKATAVERKAKKEQKDEAERHMAAEAALVGGPGWPELVWCALGLCCKHTGSLCVCGGGMLHA